MGRGWSPRNPLLPTCYAKLRRFRSNRLGACRGGGQKWWGRWGTAPPLGRGRGWLLETLHIVPIIVALGQTVWAYIGKGPKIWGKLGPGRTLGWGTWLTPRNICFSHTCITVPKSSFEVDPFERNYGDTPEKFDPRIHSRSLKVTGTDTDRSAIWLSIGDPE